MRKVDPDKHEAKRQQILKAAIACFTAKGFHRTSTAEICAEAAMSPGNLFHYFPNKQAIIAAIVDAERHDTAAYFDDAIKADDLFAELLGFMDIVLALAADPAYARLALDISGEAMRDADIGERVARSDAEIQAALRALIAAAAARGQVDPSLDPAAAATWIGALIDGIFGRVAVDPTFRPKEQAATLRLLISRFLAPRGH
ncbi:MAG: TetR/AcrR family transcriptional regulator [Rhizobiales bacterium]|nr:TetR/AcrR family transcriptional regulator [Hyphomicrobiales bacterium]